MTIGEAGAFGDRGAPMSGVTDWVKLFLYEDPKISGTMLGALGTIVGPNARVPQALSTLAPLVTHPDEIEWTTEEAVTGLASILDILSSFLGPKNIILTMKRQPGIIDACRAIILEKLLKLYDDIQDIIERYVDGFNTWMPLWCPKRWYPIQCDFSAFLSPKWFKRFALDDIKTQAEYMDYAFYHLDGPDALNHIDDILTIDF